MSLWVAGLKRLSFCSITGAGAGLEDGRFRQMALLEDGFQRGKGLNHDGAVATAFQLGLCVGTADGVVLKAERQVETPSQQRHRDRSEEHTSELQSQFHLV